MPSFFHTYVNGPVPDGVVVKLADWPGQSTRSARLDDAVFWFKVKVALFVTALHVPVTSTVYVPASAPETEAIVSVLVVLLCTAPSFFQT